MVCLLPLLTEYNSSDPRGVGNEPNSRLLTKAFKIVMKLADEKWDDLEETNYKSENFDNTYNQWGVRRKIFYGLEQLTTGEKFTKGNIARQLEFKPPEGIIFPSWMFAAGIDSDAGGNIALRGRSKTMLSGTEVGPSEQTPEVQTRMDQKSVPAALAGIYIRPGGIFSIIDGLSFGASYKQENYMSIDPFTTRNQLEVGTAVMDLKIALLDFYTPDIYNAGIAYDFSNLEISMLKGLILTLEVQYEKWSDYKVSTATEIVFNRYEIEYGSQYKLPELKNIWVYKGGLSYDAIELQSIRVTLMTGYSYRPSFIPDDAVTGKINWLDNDKHFGSGGLTFAIPQMGAMGGPLEITIGFQGQYLIKRKVIKDPQTDEEYGFNPDYTYSGWNPSGIIEITMKI